MILKLTGHSEETRIEELAFSYQRIARCWVEKSIRISSFVVGSRLLVLSLALMFLLASS